MPAISQMSMGYSKISLIPDISDPSTWDIIKEFSIRAQRQIIKAIRIWKCLNHWLITGAAGECADQFLFFYPYYTYISICVN